MKHLSAKGKGDKKDEQIAIIVLVSFLWPRWGPAVLRTPRYICKPEQNVGTPCQVGSDLGLGRILSGFSKKPTEPELCVAEAAAAS